MNQKLTICRVCGNDYKNYYPNGENYYPWGENGDSPSHDFCDCCGIEFGYEDDNINGIRIARQKWIAAGMPWNKKNFLNNKSIPSDYNPKEQLKNIPPEWL